MPRVLGRTSVRAWCLTIILIGIVGYGLACVMPNVVLLCRPCTTRGLCGSEALTCRGGLCVPTDAGSGVCAADSRVEGWSDRDATSTREEATLENPNARRE